jgi:outer membrane protein
LPGPENALKIAVAPLAARFGLLALCAAPLAQAQEAVAPGLTVAAVNTTRLVTESRLAKAAGAKIVEEFSRREKGINEKMAAFRAASAKFQAEAAQMSDRERLAAGRELAEMEKDVQRKQAEFSEDLRQRQNEERAIIAQKAFTVLVEIGKREHIDVVLQDPFWYSPRIDITDKILQQLDK